MTPQEKFDDVISHVKYFAPDFKTILKSQSRMHKVIGWLLSKFGNTGYMTKFWTTIGQTVACPSGCDTGATLDEWMVMFHEGKHASDSTKIGSIPFGCIYLFPQIIGFLGIAYALALIPLLLLGAPLSLLWGLLALLCLAPLPAPGRALLELRGYTVTLAIDFWSNSIQDEDEYINWLVTQFTGPNYYYMFPFKTFVKGYFKSKLEELKTGTLKLDAYLAVCRTKAYQYKE
jgi:hypothetical protein